jgi:RHS repeat-associated protein
MSSSTRCNLQHPRATALPIIAVLAALLGAAVPARATTPFCDGSHPGIFIDVTPGGTETSTNKCLGAFYCSNPSGVPMIGAPMPEVEFNAANSTYTVRYRYSLRMVGSTQNNGQNGTNMDFRGRVYWFSQATPPACSIFGCPHIWACGLPGAWLPFDTGDTFIEASGLKCDTLTDRGTFSFSVYRCHGAGSCERREDSAPADFSLPKLKELLGCPAPPKDDCDNCTSCKVVGGGGGNVGGKGGNASPGKSGPGAMLRYRAGGAGHTGFPGTSVWTPTLGRYWSHDYAERIVLDPVANNDSRVWLITKNATFREFWDKAASGVYNQVSPTDEYRTLTRTGTGWELRELDGRVHHFDSSGRWTQTADPNGNAKVAAYDANGKLTSVTFPDGRSETFTYHASGRLASITEVGVGGAASRTWSYVWSGTNSSGNDLVRIDRPDGTRWEFTYGNTSLPGYMTRMELVGTDNSRRVETAWEYDTQGNVVKIWSGDASFTGAGAVDKWSFGFNNAVQPTITTVIDPLGDTATYTFNRDPNSDKTRISAINGDCPSCGVGPNTNFLYEDSNNPMRPTRTIDGRNVTTAYTYDLNGMMTSQTEAFGTALARTTIWEHDGPFPGLVTRMEVPSTSGSGVKATVYTYDAAGNLTDTSISGVEAGSAFTYATETTFNAAGQPASLDPPGYGTQDVVSFTYDPARGDLLPLTRTEPLVGTTTYGYDAFNRVTAETDPNGVAVETDHDALDRIIESRHLGSSPAEDLVLIQTYNAFGDLFRTTFPEGNVTEYGYDAAGRLVSIERKPDSATPGERTLFTLDGAGNRTREELQRWNGSAWVTESSMEYVFSSRCKLDKVVYPDGTVTEYDYDCEGNLERVWDENHPSNNKSSPATQVYAYDSLGRVTSITEPWTGPGGGTRVTSYSYDPQDNLTETTDFSGTVTQFVWSDRGLLTQETSEASGATTFTYNEHGNLVTRTEARGVTVEHTIDALGRVTFLDFPENQLDTAYTWDSPTVPFAKGRLTAITRNGATIPYSFDRFGRVLQDGNLSYTYDGNSNRLTVTYPGAVTASYTYDFADRPLSLSLQDGTNPVQTVAASASYKPFGPLSGLALGNGLNEIRGFNGRYFPAALSVPGRLDWTYTTDGLGNVTAITDTLSPGGSRSFAYQDVQYFLTQGNGPWGTRSWTYDKAGNRLTETRDGATETYSYIANGAAGNSPRLSRIDSASGASELFYDAAGNQTFRSRPEERLRFTYNAERRLSQIRSDTDSATQGISQLTYDGRNLLARATFSPKAGSSTPEREMNATYSSSGLLHHRWNLRRRGPTSPRNQPEVRSDAYILYFADRPVAILDKQVSTPPSGAPMATTRLTFLTTDHLGAPVLATDASGAALWQGGFEPFGTDWNGAQAAGVFLRLPGQWDDASWNNGSLESGLANNVFRWYEGATGRYLRPDPVTERKLRFAYAYAEANPERFTDPLGLAAGGFEGPLPGPGYGSGPWGDRPNRKCCKEEEIWKALRSDVEQMRRLRQRKPLEGQITGATWGSIVCEKGQCTTYPLSPTFDPGLTDVKTDPCVRYCTRVHEWIHFQDRRPVPESWIYDDRYSYDSMQYRELPAYKQGAKCLLSFLR